MTRPYSPTIPRLELGFRLRKHREALGLSSTEVAQIAYIDKAQLSRLENGQRRAVVPYVEKLCSIYSLDSETTKSLIELAKAGQGQGWWQRYNLETQTATYVSFESAADSIDEYHALVIPGLLQTPEYSRAVLDVLRPHFTDARVEQTVKSRLARQQILTGDSPARIHAVIDESVLERTLGRPEIMRTQLKHLLEAGEADNIVIQILRKDAGASPGLDGTFTLLNFTSGFEFSALYLEGQFGQIIQLEKEQIDRCRENFRILAALAADPTESSRLIKKRIGASASDYKGVA
jgi:transcriptional regulator with XRE-family HTH domain